MDDPFIDEGMSESSDSDRPGPTNSTATTRTSACRLLAAKACRQKLKDRLLRYKTRKVGELAVRRRASVGIGESDLDE